MADDGWKLQRSDAPDVGKICELAVSRAQASKSPACPFSQAFTNLSQDASRLWTLLVIPIAKCAFRASVQVPLVRLKTRGLGCRLDWAVLQQNWLILPP